MKKLLAQLFLFGFLFFGFQQLVFSANLSSGSDFEIPPGCALQAPTNFHAGIVGTNSIEYFWSPPPAVPPGTTVTYKLSVNDITTGTSLPDKYTTGLYFLYDGLPAGHYFSATVSASACGVNGPFGGTAAPVVVQTSIIIVDDMAGLGGDLLCTPDLGSADVVNPNDIITLDLALGNGPTNSGGPKGHIKIVAFDGRSVDFAIFANGDHLAQMKEIGRSVGLERNPSAPQANVIQVTYGPEQSFLKIYDPTFNYLNPVEVNVKILFNTKSTIYSCGVPYIHGSSNGGDHLVGGVKDLNASQTSQIPSSLNDRTALSDENAPLQSIQLTPNPTGDRTMLSFSVAQTGPVQLAVYNTMGALVALPVELPEILEKGNYQVEIPSEQLPTGMYFLTLQSAAGRQTVRLVKQ